MQALSAPFDSFSYSDATPGADHKLARDCVDGLAWHFSHHLPPCTSCYFFHHLQLQGELATSLQRALPEDAPHLQITSFQFRLR